MPPPSSSASSSSSSSSSSPALNTTTTKASSTQHAHSTATPPPSSELWVDRFPPSTTAGLAVHRAKIDQVRSWLTEALDGPPALRAYRRLLVLTGPSGAGKSATIRALASQHELNFDIVEWENTWGNNIGAELVQPGPSSSSSFGNAASARSRLVPSSQSATQLFADFLASSSRFGTLNMRTDEGVPEESQASTSAQPTPPSQARSILTPPTISQRLMPPPPPPSKSKATSQASHPPSSQPSSANTARRIILLDDLPNLSHPPTRLAFQSTLAALLAHTQAQAKQYAAAERLAKQRKGSINSSLQLQLPPPIVLLLSDSTGREGDASVASDALAGRSSSLAWRKDEELNLRTVLGDELRRDPRVADIKFNPVAPTILKKALTRILDLVYASAPTTTTKATNTASPQQQSGSQQQSSRSRSNLAPKTTTTTTSVTKPKRDKAFETELIRLLVSEGGAAQEELQNDGAGNGKGKNAKRTAIERPTGGDLRSAITQMQVLYNKRVGDPGGSDDESALPPPPRSSSTTTTKSRVGKKGDEAMSEGGEERTMAGNADGALAKLCGVRAGAGEPEGMWTELPDHMKELERRTSKINLEALWAQSPVDPSLLQLYLHHNFPTFCAEIEECSAGLEYISSADSDLRIWTESWTHTSLSAYYAFLLSTGGIILSLPSPIPPTNNTQSSSGGAGGPMNGRTRHRQIRKSAFFDAFKRMRDLGESLDDVQGWMLRTSVGSAGAGAAGTLGSLGRSAGSHASAAGVGVTAELSSLSTVSRTAMAVEVVPLLAKLSRSSDGVGAGGNTSGLRTSKLHSGGTSGQSTPRSSTSKATRYAYPPSIVHIGQFDHLTASQAAQSAFALRTEALDDSGLLGGADDGEDDADDAGAVVARAGADGTAGGTYGSAWTEQVKDELSQGGDGDGDEVGVGELDGMLLGDVEGDSDPGLMDSEDEILSDE
ncbi:unnamed protein product [Tilletia caries]|uniref:AAA+ ATPase domain-containing protein n=1 Tax=Tilletia caries TaxID=13290 RepID=A0ABN7IR09_9BASI|nr:unnamed protein product [Tilletia caries]CAD7060604.1 unnamed protein product [Tilletia caries]